MTEPHDPFTPPTAELAQKSAPVPGPAWKAVLLGFLTDIGGSFATGVLYTIVFSVYLASSAAEPEEIMAFLQDPPPDSFYLWLGYMIGSAFSMLGGYVCARIAKQNEYKLGALLATLSTLVGLLITPADRPLQMVTGVVLTYVFVLLGAHLGRRKNQLLWSTL